jgi:hypothetical protein
MNKETQSTAQEILYNKFIEASKNDPNVIENPDYDGFYNSEFGKKDSKWVVAAMEEYANQKISAHQFKQSPSDAQPEMNVEKLKEKMDAFFADPNCAEKLVKSLESMGYEFVSHKEEPQGMKAALKDLVDKVELLLDTSPHNDGYEPILDDVYDCLKSCNKLLSSDAGQSSNVKEEGL